MNTTDLIKLILTIEFMLVALIVVFTYFVFWYLSVSRKNKSKKLNRFKKYIQNMLSKTKESNIKDSYKSFPNEFRDLWVIIKTINQSDHDYSNNPSWESFKNSILSHVALPLARKQASDFTIASKLLAVQAFALLPLPQDERIVLELLKSKNALIQMNAIKALVLMPSKEGIRITISKLSKERYLNQSIYLNIFNHVPDKVTIPIVQELEHLTDPYKRDVCYKILKKFKNVKFDIFPLDSDLYSSNFELRIGSIKFLSLCDPKKAVPALLKILNDPQWEAKVAALRALKEINEDAHVEAIANCLKDNNWWVRYNAAKTLMSLGNKGIDILKKQNKEHDLFAFEVSQVVLQGG